VLCVGFVGGVTDFRLWIQKSVTHTNENDQAVMVRGKWPAVQGKEKNNGHLHHSRHP
jgi:hypothetical protein